MTGIGLYDVEAGAGFSDIANGKEASPYHWAKRCQNSIIESKALCHRNGIQLSVCLTKFVEIKLGPLLSSKASSPHGDAS